jgi:hypothetical protein
LLLAGETGKRKINSIILATLLAWLYFVRPSGSIVVVAVTVFILLFHRNVALPFVLSGAVWLIGFFGYSWIHFAKLLPSYYQANRLRFDLLPVALAGNLISPSRGLIIYVPALLFVGYLLARYWDDLRHKKLAALAVAICTLHILFVSAFANLWGDWWGGASFGPRYTTELVPWFVLLIILGLKSRGTRTRISGERWHYVEHARGVMEAKTHKDRWRFIELVAGGLLVLIGIFINGRGATSLDTWKWSQPSTDQQLRAQLWDWRHPQFLAGLQTPPPPAEFPLVQPGTDVDLGQPEAGKFLWYGWSGAESGVRWSDGKEATIVFSVTEPRNLLLEIRMQPFLPGRQIVSQRVNLKLNNQDVQSLTLIDPEMKGYRVTLPQSALKHQNVVTLEMPDAASPLSLKIGNDYRVLGIRVGSIHFQAAD